MEPHQFPCNFTRIDPVVFTCTREPVVVIDSDNSLPSFGCQAILYGVHQVAYIFFEILMPKTALFHFNVAIYNTFVMNHLPILKYASPFANEPPRDQCRSNQHNFSLRIFEDKKIQCTADFYHDWIMDA